MIRRPGVPTTDPETLLKRNHNVKESSRPARVRRTALFLSKFRRLSSLAIFPAPSRGKGAPFHSYSPPLLPPVSPPRSPLARPPIAPEVPLQSRRRPRVRPSPTREVGELSPRNRGKTDFIGRPTLEKKFPCTKITKLFCWIIRLTARLAAVAAGAPVVRLSPSTQGAKGVLLCRRFRYDDQR